jgi:hypothetical protein
MVILAKTNNKTRCHVIRRESTCLKHYDCRYNARLGKCMSDIRGKKVGVFRKTSKKTKNYLATHFIHGTGLIQQTKNILLYGVDRFVELIQIVLSSIFDTIQYFSVKDSRKVEFVLKNLFMVLFFIMLSGFSDEIKALLENNIMKLPFMIGPSVEVLFKATIISIITMPFMKFMEITKERVKKLIKKVAYQFSKSSRHKIDKFIDNLGFFGACLLFVFSFVMVLKMLGDSAALRRFLENTGFGDDILIKLETFMSNYFQPNIKISWDSLLSDGGLLKNLVGLVSSATFFRSPLLHTMNEFYIPFTDYLKELGQKKIQLENFENEREFVKALCEKIYGEDNINVDELGEKEYERLKEMVLSHGTNNDKKLKRMVSKYRTFLGGARKVKTQKKHTRRQKRLRNKQ